VESEIKHEILHKIIEQREPGDILFFNKNHLFCYPLSIEEYISSEVVNQIAASATVY
jgi:hypothetical protein